MHVADASYALGTSGLTTVRAIAGRVFGEPMRKSMIWINQLRWMPAHSRVAQPHR
jgi:hypothetical protein